MTGDFQNWLAQNGLTPVFTTTAGDTLYVSYVQRFAFLQKYGTVGGQSFFLHDIVEVQTFDDENLMATWNRMMPFQVMPRSTSHSTNEVYMKIRLSNNQILKVQIFKAVHGNIERDSISHANLCNYACQLSHVWYNCVMGV